MCVHINKAKLLAKQLILDEAETLASDINSKAKLKRQEKGYNKILDVYRETYRQKYGLYPQLDKNKFNAVIKKSLNVIDNYSLLIKLAEFFITDYDNFSFVNRNIYPNPVIGGFSIFIEKIFFEYKKKMDKEKEGKEVGDDTMPISIKF